MEKLSASILNDALNKQFQLMETSGAVLVKVAVDNEEMWQHYQNSFPAGTNDVFRVNREYDCNCCKNFIRKIGAVVAISPNGLQTIWDVTVEGYFQDVANSMAAYIRTKPLAEYFFNSESVAGGKPNKDNTTDIVWNHLYLKIPKKYVIDNIGQTQGDLNGTRDLYERGLNELTLDAAETVLELINQNSLYRGAEFKHLVESFIKEKKEFDKISNPTLKQYHVWTKAKKVGASLRFKNSVIGTLVADLSSGVDLESAVKMFESKVAPTNYKRTSALVTPKMIKDAQAKIAELGLEESLYRKFAEPSEISVNNVLFHANNTKALSVFDEMSNEAATKAKPKNLAKIEEVSIEHFINNIIPNAQKIEVLVQNKHVGNFMSVVSPVDQNAKNITKWGNGFTWSYNGDITDSIKERVKNAGGNVSGAVRASLSWFNYDDLDLQVTEPNGIVIKFSNKVSQFTGGRLDIDMNAGSGQTREAVENIFWETKTRMAKGDYKVKVHNFSKRESKDVGFDLQIELDGVITDFSYKKAVANNDLITVCTLHYDGNVVTIKDVGAGIEESKSSKDVWNVKTETFVPVKMIMNSPNYWDDNQVGNKHTFFILENCKNPDKVRGFYNEYLQSGLEQYRKVFELLGEKTKAEPTDNQVSGVGFSSTKRDSVIVQVTGKTKRQFVVNF